MDDAPQQLIYSFTGHRRDKHGPLVASVGSIAFAGERFAFFGRQSIQLIQDPQDGAVRHAEFFQYLVDLVVQFIPGVGPG